LEEHSIIALNRSVFQTQTGSSGSCESILLLL
jgi:hypothetical protein